MGDQAETLRNTIVLKYYGNTFTESNQLKVENDEQAESLQRKNPHFLIAFEGLS